MSAVDWLRWSANRPTEAVNPTAQPDSIGINLARIQTLIDLTATASAL